MKIYDFLTLEIDFYSMFLFVCFIFNRYLELVTPPLLLNFVFFVVFLDLLQHFLWKILYKNRYLVYPPPPMNLFWEGPLLTGGGGYMSSYQIMGLVALQWPGGCCRLQSY